MSAPPSQRPVWRYMGWWKWPSLGLLLFCALAITLYFDRAPGGADGWGEQRFEGRLAGCPLRVGARQAEGGIAALVWIDPACAWRLAEPRIEFLSREGEPLMGRELGGLPNPDRLRLPADSFSADSVVLSVSARTGPHSGAARARLRWTLSQGAGTGAS